MKIKTMLSNYRPYIPVLMSMVLLVLFGLYLFIYSHPQKIYSDELLITDCIWLDAWALAFFLVVVVVWCSSVNRQLKSRLLITMFSLYGFIAVCLILDGTLFGFNAYWGDQKFRTAMLTKFITFVGWPDFYYKDLPAFYPPVYYFLLSLYARIFSVEAFKMIKIGTMLIYLFGPIVLYAFWRKLVSPMQALLVTMCTFLFYSVGKNIPFHGPHAFLANSFFIPWWLYFVEQVRRPKADWKYYFWGGAIGGAIFMTYYYPFFIGGLLLVGRTIFQRHAVHVFGITCRLRQAWGILVSAAIFSAPFWFPLILGMLNYGSDAAQQEWHHLSSTGIAFKFVEFSIPGLLTLVALYQVFVRRHQALYRALLLLIATIIIYYFIGAVLGALHRPVNLIKANEFVLAFAGPMIGMFLARLLRAGKMRRKASYAIPLIVAMFLLFFLNAFNGFAKNPRIKTSRTAKFPSYYDDRVSMLQRAGSVFLTGYEELFAFFPVYSFIAANQHYSNPTAQFNRRYNLLTLLYQFHARDIYLLAVGLRHNIFDPVDYFMPRMHKNHYEIYVSLSNYPNKHKSRVLKFQPPQFDDHRLFHKESRKHLFAVLAPPPDYPERVYPESNPRDSLLFLAKARVLMGYLDSDGDELVSRYAGADWSGWRTIKTTDKPHRFDNEISLMACEMMTDNDSLYMFFAVRAERDIRRDYRVFLHLFPDDVGTMLNYDFVAEPETKSWEKGDIFVLTRTIPVPATDFSFGVGFFAGDHTVGRAFNRQVEL